MSEKLYPLIIWFCHQNERRLFEKVSFGESIDKHSPLAITKKMGEAIQSLCYEAPIEIALGMNTATVIELVRVNGVDIHTLEEEAVVFNLTLESENYRILEISNDSIRSLFEKRFSDFRKTRKKSLREKRGDLTLEMKRLDEICRALDF